MKYGQQMKLLRRTMSAPRWAMGVYTLFSTPVWAQGIRSSRQTDETAGILVLLTIAIVALAIYVIPSIIAFRRQHPNRWPIFLINIVFGGTILGWIGPLIWAMGAVHKSKTGSDGGESGLNIFANDPVLVKVNPTDFSIDDTDDIVEQLTKIKKLFDQDAINQEEYDRLRKPLIEQLAHNGPQK